MAITMRHLAYVKYVKHYYYIALGLFRKRKWEKRKGEMWGIGLKRKKNKENTRKT